MLALHCSNWDIHVYFENDEISRMQNEKVKGLFFQSNMEYPHVPFEIMTREGVWEGVETKIDKLPDGTALSVEMKISTRYFETFQEKRFYEFHQAYRHVMLLDTENLDFHYRFNYMKLKTLESKLKKAPAPTSEYFMKLFAKAITNKNKK